VNSRDEVVRGGILPPASQQNFVLRRDYIRKEFLAILAGNSYEKPHSYSTD